MPRTTLTLIAIFWHILAFGQLKITTTTYNGKTYKVYPVRVPFPDTDSEWYGDFTPNEKTLKNGIWERSTQESTLPFNPFKVPDGEYLVYYKKKQGKWDKENKVYIQSHKDTATVAATFELSNNKRNGKAVWYDFGKRPEILQTGYYKDGLKEGEWIIYRKNEKRVYQYEKGLLNGLDIEYYKGKIITEQRWVTGFRDGEVIEYYDYKKGNIERKARYDRGSVIENKEYDDKGRLTYWFNRNNTDNIRRRYYKKGVLYKTVSENDTLGIYEEKIWSDKGQLMYIGYRYEQWSDEYRSIYAQPWYNKYNRSVIKRVGGADEIAVEKYHPNGQLRLKYDMRTDDLRKPINTYSEDGSLLSQCQMDPEDSMFVIMKEFDEKKGYLSRLDVSFHSRNWMFNCRFNEQGDTTYYNADPFYLSQKNKTKKGFVKSYQNSYSKDLSTHYNLLHTSYTVESNSNKGKPNLTVDFNTINDSTVLVTQTEHDEDQWFEVIHTYALKTAQYTDYFIDHPYRLDGEVVEPKHIMELYDTLDYRINLFGRPYYGDIDIEEEWTKHSKRYSVKLKIEKHNVDGYVYYDTTVQLTSYLDGKEGYGTNFLKVSDGQVIHIQSGWANEADYVNSKKHGEGTDRLGYRGNYEHGIRHGVYKSYSHISEYYMGKKHGMDIKFGYYSQYKHYDHQLEYKATFVMDTLQGLFQSFAEPEVVGQTVNFDKGYPHGTYFRGNVTAPTSVSVNLEHGYLIDTGYYYFKEGTIKVKVNYRLEDSVFYKSYGRPYSITGRNTDPLTYFDYYRGETFLSTDKIIDFESSRTGDYQYFYKNGVMASKGRIESRQKIGTWQHWDLNGQLYKEITYDSGWYVNPITQDSLFYYGKVQMWYPNGKKLLTGLIKDSEMKFKCDQEMKVDMETLYYLTFFEQDGTQSISDGSGKVVEFHNNGETRLTGELKNGRRYGLWKFYDPNGRLEEIGKYDEYGRKHGLWVKGDLEAVPYFENLCVEGSVSAYNFPDVDQTGYVMQEITVSETHYEHGYFRDSNKMTLLPLY